MPSLVIIAVSLAACSRLLASSSQIAINDFAPFGAPMLKSCVLPYDLLGLGRDNAHTIPAFCDYGLLALLLGGTVAQHLVLVLCFAGAGGSMYYLLRRLGNDARLSLFGAVVYEFSPIMLAFRVSGEGLLVTAALLPAVLAGAFPRASGSATGDGARTGALLALACYANPQAPALAILLLLPVVGLRLAGRDKSDLTAVLRFSATGGAIFLVGVLPVIQILPSFTGMVQGMQAELQSDLAARLLWNSVADFAIPYTLLGLIPAALAVVVAVRQPGIRLPALASSLTLVWVLGLWEGMKLAGAPVVAHIPVLALYKDFIKLQIVISLPIVILSIVAIRWLLEATKGAAQRPRLVGAGALGALTALPLVAGVQNPIIYTTPVRSLPNISALASGRLGIPDWASVPPTYTRVLGSIERTDPQVNSYRVLWLPIDWRLLQLSRAVDSNLLIFRSDNSSAAQKATLNAFQAIANEQEMEIAPLLADLSVKYVVVDLTDGQDMNTEPWQKGAHNLAAVWDTEALAGSPSEYAAILRKAPGLRPVANGPGWITYVNTLWRSTLTTYSGMLNVLPAAEPAPAQMRSLPLRWSGYPGVVWHRNADGAIQIAAKEMPAGTVDWAPVSAFFDASAGTAYQISGSVQYENVHQAHVKIIWHGDVAEGDRTTFLMPGRDGSGSYDFLQIVEVPPGATSGELFLMGGSSSTQGFTQFSDVTVSADEVPILRLQTPDDASLFSIRRQLPSLFVHIGASASPAIRTRTLVEGDAPPPERHDSIQLVTANDFATTKGWTVDALPNPLGLERFTSRPGSMASLPFGTQPLTGGDPGFEISWIEYPSGEASPGGGVVHTSPVGPGTFHIACSAPMCTIANVLIIPPLPTGKALARYAFAYSPYLRSTTGAPPIEVNGDWASYYVPPPDAPPSPSSDPSVPARIAVVAMGHLAILLGLLLGIVWLNRRKALIR